MLQRRRPELAGAATMTGAMRKAFAERPGELDARNAPIAARQAVQGICQAWFEAFVRAERADRIVPVAHEAMFRCYR